MSLLISTFEILTLFLLIMNAFLIWDVMGKVEELILNTHLLQPGIGGQGNVNNCLFVLRVNIHYIYNFRKENLREKKELGQINLLPLCEKYVVM